MPRPVIFILFNQTYLFHRFHLKVAATRGGAAGGVGAEEDKVGQQDDHLGHHTGQHDHLGDRDDF